MNKDTEKTLIEIISKLHTKPIEDHACRFNDGPFDCQCYLEGLRDARHIIKEFILNGKSS